MPFYYFNNKVDNHYRHEIHIEDCPYIPELLDRTFIGLESNCKAAISRAKREHPTKDFDGCYYCCIECHKS